MPSASLPDLSLEESTLVGTLCDEFELRCRSGASTDLAGSLRDARLAGRRGPVLDSLFCELLKLDVWYRISRKEQPSCDDYCRRFEEYRKFILRLRLLFPVNQTFAGYPLLRMLGSGGMADTFLTRAGSQQRVVAIKLLRMSSVAGRDDRARFRRELRSSELSHPNIVKVFDADEADGRSFLLMELIRGRTLYEIVQDLGRLQVADACTLVRQAAAGLECAHAAGVIHRDVNPKNLMLDVSGTVKVIDFGLAKWLAEHPVDALTQAGACLGTPGYMAPEQVLADGSIDARTDIFGLGATLYFLLTGERAIGGSNWSEFRAAMADFRVRHVAELRPDIPPDLISAIEDMLARDPAVRMASMQAVQTALAPHSADCHLPSLLSEEFIGMLDDVVEEMSEEQAGPAAGNARATNLQPTFIRRRRFLFASAAVLASISSASIWRIICSFRTDEWGLATADVLFRMAEPPKSVVRAFALRPRRLMSEVICVDWSPDGAQLAVGLQDGGVLLCSADRPNDWRTLARHRDAAKEVRWNRQGTLIASACGDGTIYVIDDHANLITTIESNSSLVDIAWSPVADTLASIDEKGYACLWDSRGRSLVRFAADKYYGSRIVWNADGTRLATCGGDKCVHFWRPDGSPAGQTGQNTAGTHSLCWSPQGFLLARADDPDRQARAGRSHIADVWNPRTQLWSPLAPERQYAESRLTLNRDGSRLACHCGDGTTWIGTLELDKSGELALSSSVRVPSSESFSLAWHPSKPRLAICRKSIAIWDLSAPGGAELLSELKPYQARPLRHVQRQPGGEHFAFSGDEKLLQIRRFDGKLVADMSGREQVTQFAWSPDGKALATGSSAGMIRFHSPLGAETAAFDDHAAGIDALAWHPGGTWTASCDGAKTIRCHHPENGRGPVIRAGDAVVALCWSSDGEFLIDGLAGLAGIQAWEAAHGFREFRRPPSGLPGSLRDHVNVLAPHPSQPLLAAGAAYGTLILWRWSDGRWKPLTYRREGHRPIHEGSLQRAAWSEDGQRLATAANDGLIALWTARGSFVGELRTRSPISALRWSPDNRWLAAGDAAGTLWICDFAGNRGFRLPGYLGRVESLDWSADSRQVVMAMQGGALLRVDVASQTITSTLLFGAQGRFAELDAKGEFLDGDRSLFEEFTWCRAP